MMLPQSVMKIFLSTVILIGIFIIGCNAGKGKDRNVIQVKKENTSVICYECNSAYDPRCGEDFNNFTIGTVNCSMKTPIDYIVERPTFCRKVIQKVQGQTRVIRGCGYVEDAREFKQCIRRTGTHDVNVLYCSCRGDFCNLGHIDHRPTFRIVMGMLLGALLITVSGA